MRRLFVRLTEIRDVLTEIRDQALPIEDAPCRMHTYGPYPSPRIPVPKGRKVWSREDRDREILRGFEAGETNTEIAARMRLTPGTVRFYVSALYDTLGHRKRAKALAVAIRRGLLPG